MLSKFEEHLDGNNAKCPYCGDEFQVETEDFNETPHEVNCEECGKSYYLNQSFSVVHYSIPDCELNGEQHDYQRIDLADGSSHPFCTVCGKCQPFQELRVQQ